LLAEAGAVALCRADIRGLRNVKIVRGMRFLNDDQRDVQVIARRAGDACDAKLVADFRDRNGRVMEAGRVHLTGSAQREAAAPLAEFSKPPFPLNPMIYVHDAPMFHGPALRKLESLMFQHDGGYARLRAPDPAELAGDRPAGGWFVPGALLDGCLVACAVYSYLMCGQRVEIPETFEELDLFRAARIDELCLMRFFYRGEDDRRSRFDFILFGDDEQPILQARGFGTVALSKEVE
jgi:hypothetical protein